MVPPVGTGTDSHMLWLKATELYSWAVATAGGKNPDCMSVGVGECRR